jgi:2,3-diketo-5-methylthio-1-phosphopentane phosphatase
MRIGPDVSPAWDVDGARAIPGLEAALPSLRGALRSTLDRLWMHRRLWLNDPDCLMARRRDTQLRDEEVRTLAAAIAVSGGVSVFSDDVPRLSADDRGSIRETLELAREVDGAAPVGVARQLTTLSEQSPGVIRASRGSATLLAFANLGDEPVKRELSYDSLGLTSQQATPDALLSTRGCVPGDGAFSLDLAAHETALVRVRQGRELAVFCDFDGTFAIQDVGATLAKQYASDRRPALWKLYERGELTAWEYNMELLDGLEVPEKALSDFLETIELDPGARNLLAWCEEREVPFRILSDGFDYNLERLQELNAIRFEYTANRLRYEGDLWRIGSAAPNPDCFCGTGACKRGWIESYRQSHPGSYCVHVGNGFVSDLCGALEADLAFAKDSLAPALEERGVAFESFETLNDVVSALDRLGWE